MQVDRYVMHQLFELEQTALSSYAHYNFPKGSDVLFQDLAVDLKPFQLSLPLPILPTPHSHPSILISQRITYTRMVFPAQNAGPP
jgi:hypothetical protein